MAAQPQCNTIETLRQVIEGNVDKVGDACNGVAAKAVESCSGIGQIFAEHSYAHSAATLAELGIGLSIALMTELVTSVEPPDPLAVRGRFDNLKNDLAKALAKAGDSNDPESHGEKAMSAHKKEARAIRRDYWFGLTAYYLFKWRKGFAFVGLLCALFVIWALAYMHPVSKGLVMGMAFTGFSLPSVLMVLLKNHKNHK